MTHTNQTNASAQPWTCWEKKTFDQGFVSKQNSFIWKLYFRQKKVEGRGEVSKILDLGVETFSD